ncbi:MAG: DNA helicase RecQ [Candidatus Cyclobacteriaceae bacterium M3_2C_046]
MSAQPLQILKEKFGYDAFRLDQEAIIQSTIQKKDTFVLMPTGGGKSICYQVPALVFEGLTIVISPLIALMKDQVDYLKLMNIPAAFLNSSLSVAKQKEVLNQVQNNRLKLLYLAPERLLANESSFLDFLSKVKVSLFAIDEAHCISHWGHDFRPEYLMLAKLKKQFPETPVMALTATADIQTRRDILEKLNIGKARLFVSSFNRKNIHYFVEPKQNSYSRLISFLNKHQDEAGIIYVLTRDSTESLSDRLNTNGFNSLPYHAGLERGVREKTQEKFLKDRVKIIVATVAFGMGIDKSNVRFVVHMDLPKNVESYYQETGRAGRDGLKSEALLLYSYADAFKLRFFIDDIEDEQQQSIMLKKLNSMVDYGQVKTCRRQFLMRYFDEDFPSYCGTCDVCLTDYERFDGTIIAQKALSAVARLKEGFGLHYIIDFLKGADTAKIQPQHKSIKTYGVGQEHTKTAWIGYIRELISLGYLQQSDGKFPVLQLTNKSYGVLKGKEKVMLVKQTSRKEAITTDNAYEQELFLQLKEIRLKLANRENVPPYLVFSDATLRDLATYLPQSFDDLLNISGFGEYKANKYGREFLNVVHSYCKKQNLSHRMRQKPVKSRRKPTKVATDTKQQSLLLYKQGKSVTEISQERSLSEQTIYNHLHYFIFSGQLDVKLFVSPEKNTAINEVFDQKGEHALTPIKAALGQDYSFEEIKAVLEDRRRKRKPE